LYWAIEDRVRSLPSLFAGPGSFIERPACGYKRLAIALGPNFYWTNSIPSSSIEVVPRISPSPNRGAMTGPSPQDSKSDAWARLDQLTDDTVRRVAVGVAGALVTGGAILAARSVGSEQHTWWGWLLIGAPLIWLSFMGMVALTFGALRIVVGALRLSLSLTARTSAQARVAVPTCLSFLRAGYPQGVPTTDTFPLLAVLPPTAVR
jgi:uncharacterized protein DUF3349